MKKLSDFSRKIQTENILNKKVHAHIKGGQEETTSDIGVEEFIDG